MQPELTWKDILKDVLFYYEEKETDIVEVYGVTQLNKTPIETYYDEKGWIVWTKTRVYFPHVYDSCFGSNVYSVPRDPCNETFLKEN